MANWKYEIELNQLLQKLSEEYDLSCVEEKCPTKVKEMIAKEIEKAPPLRQFGNRIRNAKSIAAVNRLITNQVFDAADQHLVWCGL